MDDSSWGSSLCSSSWCSAPSWPAAPPPAVKTPPAVELPPAMLPPLYSASADRAEKACSSVAGRATSGASTADRRACSAWMPTSASGRPSTCCHTRACRCSIHAAVCCTARSPSSSACSKAI
eukprot:1002601-Prymnesium_polylepis.1